MSGEVAHAQCSEMPGVQEGRRRAASEGHRPGDQPLLLRAVQEAVRDPLDGADPPVTGIVRDLIRIRDDQGITPATHARMAGMSRQQYQAIECGRTKSPGVLVIERLAAALGYRLTLARAGDYPTSR